ncbi:MAG TPA: hypothetical protein VFR68_10595 [Candidatus Dormibacteraeota bacterium]|nr:hypothetical protein [Candidatus Dormibacteraeota bacterium]
MIRSRRAGLTALVLGLAVAILIHGRFAAPPIYDGIYVPPAPYRYESPPPNLRAGNQPPLGGEVRYPVQNGQVPGGGVTTGDNQVIIFFGPGFFKAPPGATSVTCSIEPDANPPAPPSGEDIRGNVYRINCVGEPGNGPVSVTSTFHLTMRLPAGKTNDIRFYDGQSWQTLQTLFAPQGDPYASANAPGFGEYAAMARSGAQSGDNVFSMLGRYAEFYGILALVIIFGVIAVVQEIRRRRLRRPPKAKGNR